MKKYFKIASFMMVGFMLSSCLKDDSLVLDPSKGTNVIEFENTAEIAVHGSSIPLYVHSYPITATPTPLTVTVSYSGPASGAPEDIKVKVSLGDLASITKYNTEQKTAFELLDPAAYSLGNLDLTIPKGQKKASFEVKFNTNKFDLTKATVLPLKIVSASSGTVSGNFNVILLNVGAKNAYDGVFNYTTSANTSLVPNKNSTTELITVNATTVRIAPGLLDTYSNAVSYTVDPLTNAVTVTCPSLGVQTPQDTRSKWDPATKTMTVFWKQGNGGRTFEEKFVFSRSR
jgi:hypothetical protein